MFHWQGTANIWAAALGYNPDLNVPNSLYNIPMHEEAFLSNLRSYAYN